MTAGKIEYNEILGTMKNLFVISDILFISIVY